MNTKYESRTSPIGSLGRILIAFFFLAMGFAKVFGMNQSIADLDYYGIPGSGIIPGALAALEIIGGVALLMGWAVRTVCIVMIFEVIASALVFHSRLGDRNQMMLFLTHVAIIGGLLETIVAHSLARRRVTTGTSLESEQRVGKVSGVSHPLSVADSEPVSNASIASFPVGASDARVVNDPALNVRQTEGQRLQDEALSRERELEQRSGIPAVSKEISPRPEDVDRKKIA